MSGARFICQSDVGRKRSLNEDAWCADERLGFGAVFDGMGGHGGGDVASWLAANIVLERVCDGQTLEQAFLAAHRGIREAADSGAGASTMGCTAAAMLVREGHYTVSWLGDSRCYLFDENGRLWQLSRDHSFVQRLVDRGVIDDAGAADHPERHVVTQCLGDQRLAPEPETLQGWLQPGQRILLCSDGLSGEISDDRIEQILQSHEDDEEAARALISAANEAGGGDNITVALMTYNAGGRPGAARRGSGRKGTSPMRAVQSREVRRRRSHSGLLRVTAFLGGILLVAVPAVYYYVQVHGGESRPGFGAGGGAAAPGTPAEGQPGEGTEEGEEMEENAPAPESKPPETSTSAEDATKPQDEASNQGESGKSSAAIKETVPAKEAVSPKVATQPEGTEKATKPENASLPKEASPSDNSAKPEGTVPPKKTRRPKKATPPESTATPDLERPPQDVATPTDAASPEEATKPAQAPPPENTTTPADAASAGATTTREKTPPTDAPPTEEKLTITEAAPVEKANTPTDTAPPDATLPGKTPAGASPNEPLMPELDAVGNPPETKKDD